MTVAALLLAVLLEVLDAWTTLRILALGGVELNPFLAWLMGRLGSRRALALKVALVISLLAGAWGAGLFDLAPWGAWLIAALGALTVANNLVVIARLKR